MFPLENHPTRVPPTASRRRRTGTTTTCAAEHQGCDALEQITDGRRNRTYTAAEVSNALDAFADRTARRSAGT
jgi:hypothetical protein